MNTEQHRVAARLISNQEWRKALIRRRGWPQFLCQLLRELYDAVGLLSCRWRRACFAKDVAQHEMWIRGGMIGRQKGASKFQARWACRGEW